MRFSSLLNVDSKQIKTRSFEYRGQQFSVRIPTIGEIEAFEARLRRAKDEVAQIGQIYDKRRQALAESDEVIFTDSDVLIKGISLREQAKNQYISELRIAWLFNLLVKVNDDGLGDLTYDDIAQELPMQLQTEIVDLISKAMHPEAEETKKNSLEAAPDNSTSTSWPMAGDQKI